MKFELIVIDEHYFIDNGTFAHITQLILTNSRLTSLLPLRQWHSLSTIDLSGNRIVSIASGIKEKTIDDDASTFLPNLRILHLNANGITTQTLHQIGWHRLSTIRELYLANNSITRLDPCIFARLVHLDVLDISRNQIQSIARKCIRVTRLNIDTNRLKDINGIDAPNIAYLDVSNNRIGNCAALKNVATFKTIVSLNCIGNAVTNRRVYRDYVRSLNKTLQILDNQPVNEREFALPPVKPPSFNDNDEYMFVF